MLITEPIRLEQLYQALLDRDPSFTGTFFAAVRTTSVFCISTCRARKPKRENVEFYTTFKDALDNGYRPCKICKPTENANETPTEIRSAIELVRNQPKTRITDQHLREAEIHPAKVRRWFKQHYGITFQAFQRMYRINSAYKELKSGKRTTETAFASGYDSLSGFGYTYKAVLGKAPSTQSVEDPILIDRITTPLGPMFACATNKGLCLLEFVDRRMLETEFKDLQKRLNSVIISGENAYIRNTRKQLEEYFKGARRTFSVPLHMPGTTFQQTAWNALLTIPASETRSYQDQAMSIGNKNAVRAVARANGMNRIAILVPCHRVIGKDGQLTGYGGGLERKRWLLDHEAQLTQVR